MSEAEDPLAKLSPGAAGVAKAALELKDRLGHETLGVNHWLTSLLARYAPMAEDMLRGVTARQLRAQADGKLSQGDAGEPMPLEAIVEAAVAHAQSRGREKPNERDLCAAILASAGYEPAEPPPFVADKPASAGQMQTSTATVGGGASADALSAFGRDLTMEAQEGRLPKVVGRDRELDMIIEVLCRRTKRNPLLVGPAGCGKTAIVEGLAARVVRGEVPDLLKNRRVVAIQPSVIVAGASLAGEMEKRVRSIIEEAAREQVILFIDEIHSMVSAGGRTGTTDIASQLKPSLARGELTCIGATTDEDYRLYIEPDAALERRFQPIRVQEMTCEQALAVLESVRDELSRLRGVEVSDGVLSWIVRFADRAVRNRVFPDKGIDLLEQCIAHAVASGKSVVDLQDAKVTAQRVVGAPIDVRERLVVLEEALASHRLMDDERSRQLVERLSVTMRGLDMRPWRPDAVLLLVGWSPERREELCTCIAKALFDDPRRSVTLDFSRLMQQEDVTLLLGAPPAYIGHEERVPLHAVAQMQNCVLKCENIDRCHAVFHGILAQALTDGFFTDSRGKRIYLSNTVVLLTTSSSSAVRRTRLGFGVAATASSEDEKMALVGDVPAQLLGQCDIICDECQARAVTDPAAELDEVLGGLCLAWRAQGIELEFDATAVGWMKEQWQAHGERSDWEHILDQHVAPLLAQYVEEAISEKVRRIRLTCVGGKLVPSVANPEGGE